MDGIRTWRTREDDDGEDCDDVGEDCDEDDDDDDDGTIDIQCALWERSIFSTCVIRSYNICFIYCVYVDRGKSEMYTRANHTVCTVWVCAVV